MFSVWNLWKQSAHFMINLFSHMVSNKPLVPVLVKDPNTGLLILFLITLIATLLTVRILRKYDG